MLDLVATPAYFMDDRKMEKIIEDHFGVEYCIVAMNELRNDSIISCEVDKKPDELDDEYVQEWLSGEGDGMWIIHSIIHDLVMHDVIPPGRYVIDCSW